MCEELPGDADRMPISAEGSPDGTVGPVCRYLTQCRNPGKSKWRNRRAVWPTRPTLLTVTIGRQAVGWPSSHCGSWNVKMVDGKPTQPRDSVFAASQVDCVCSMLTLPSDRRMPGAGWHLLTSLRGQSHSQLSPGPHLSPSVQLYFSHLQIPGFTTTTPCFLDLFPKEST